MQQMDTSLSPEMSALKTKLKATWEAGDYGTFAKFLEPSALEFFQPLDIPAGAELLDIACGAGQLSIPAARRGIRVSAIDLAQNLVDQARTRAQAEGLDIDIRQGDAESLPYPDAAFDVVLSLIGAMFAPRPQLVASEMLRVCRPGGSIVMGNWTPEGFIGQMFKVIGKHVPPPSIFPSPLQWGSEEIVKQRFADGVSELEFSRPLYRFHYPFGPEEVVDFFVKYYGPTNRAFSVLDTAGRAAMKSELTQLWSSQNTDRGGGTHVLAEYLQVIGRRR